MLISDDNGNQEEKKDIIHESLQIIKGENEKDVEMILFKSLP